MIRTSISIFAAITAITILEGCNTDSPSVGIDSSMEKVEILWDEWGVPHIYGDNEDAAAYGWGWSMMQTHGDLMLELYGQARGRAAEYWGEEYLEGDRFLQTMGAHRAIDDLYAAQSPEYKQRIEAFIQGANDFASAHPDSLDPDRRIALPLFPRDAVAHHQRILHLVIVMAGNQYAARSWAAQSPPGSNAWAIGPGRSASGNAMLLQNSHLDWNGMFLYTEFHLNAPGLNAYGTTFVGMPFPIFTFTENMGWAFTISSIDNVDLYELQLADGGYRFGNEIREFDKRNEKLRIRQADGSMREESFEVLESVHGPVLAKRGDKAIAARLAGFRDPAFASVTEQFWEMAKAANFDEFKAAFSHLQLPCCNIIYADKEGNTYLAWGGQMPRKPSGDVSFWRGIVDGSDPDLLWDEYVPLDELPQVLNPEGGFVQSSNDSPFTSTFPQAIHVEDYPPYFSRESMGARPQHGARLLLQDESITFDELVEYRTATEMLMAEYLLPDLVPAALATHEDLLVEAGRVLGAWDYRADADSRGTVLFVEWIRQLSALSGARSFDAFYAEPWDPERPLATPRGIADIAGAVNALRTAAEKVQDAYGSLDVPWGDVARVIYGPHDLPSSAGVYGLGSFRVGALAPAGDDRYKVVSGSTWVAAIEFGEKLRAKGLLVYGNTSNQDSPHYGDQIPLFSEGKLRDVRFYRDDVEAHVKRREELTYTAD